VRPYRVRILFLLELTRICAADVLEFTAVTANGTIVHCSPYQNPSLFTALRGGGSAFAVVTSVAFKAHGPPSGFVGIFGSFGLRDGANATGDSGKGAWKEVVKRWIDLQPRLSDAGSFAGYSYIVRLPSCPFRGLRETDTWWFAASS